MTNLMYSWLHQTEAAILTLDLNLSLSPLLKRMRHDPALLCSSLLMNPPEQTFNCYCKTLYTADKMVEAVVLQASTACFRWIQ